MLKRPINHKSWLTGFRGFVRIPSTIPPAPPDWISGYLDYGKQFVAASPIRTSVWSSPAGGFFFSRKNRSLGFCNLKQCFLHSTKTMFNPYMGSVCENDTHIKPMTFQGGHFVFQLSLKIVLVDVCSSQMTVQMADRGFVHLDMAD